MTTSFVSTLAHSAGSSHCASRGTLRRARVTARKGGQLPLQTVPSGHVDVSLACTAGAESTGQHHVLSYFSSWDRDSRSAI
uniref:Uncharacterized protein n=1 Tax=Hyaloperonospora arabidopsidis (strain Emoy2) TaxID=559515 RepID=M4BAE6_HYAAE